MAYDPDGDPDDLDPEDVDAFLSDPGNVAMWESLRERFRESPGGEQIAVLRDVLADAITRRDELAAVVQVEDVAEDDPRRVLLAACASEVEVTMDRIVELIGPAPDHP